MVTRKDFGEEVLERLKPSRFEDGWWLEPRDIKLNLITNTEIKSLEKYGYKLKGVGVDEKGRVKALFYKEKK
jgi:hypothetical protein